MVCLVKKLHGVRLTKPKPPRPIPPDPPQAISPEGPLPQVQYKELFLQVVPISRFYTDDTGLFPVRSLSGHQYVIIVYHCDTNLILAVPFKTSKDTHRL